MSQHSDGSSGSKKKQSKQASKPVQQPAVVENLEQRQMLSGVTGSDSSALLLQHVMQPAEVVPDRVPTAHQLQVVQTWVTNFEKHIRLEVKLHPHLQHNAHFQNSIAHQQAVFAAKVAKFGVTYTPIPFDTLLVGTAPLTAPTLTATATSSSAITLNWTATPSVQHYVLQSSLNGVNWTTLPTPASNTYVNTNLAADSTHRYRVAAVVAGRTSPESAIKTATTLLPAPTGFSAVPFSATRVDLHWTPVTHATSYKIERSPNNSTWTALTPSPALNANSISYSDTTAIAGTSYYYRLTAIETLGNSAATSGVAVLTLPAVPALTATVASATKVNLNWGTITGAATYKLEISTNGGNTWSTRATPTATTYADTSLAADTAYKYRVSAVDAAGTSAPSTPVSFTTPLNAPTGLTVAAVSPTCINLAWNPITDATSYKIERSVDQTAWTTLVPSPALNAASVSSGDTGVSAGTTYYYRISALDAAGSSAASTVAHALTFPATPVLTATVTSAAVITLNWVGITSATSYLVEASPDGSVWTSLASPVTPTYANTALGADTVHEYRVSANNATGQSTPSNVVSKTTVLASPSGLAATAVSTTEIDLTFTPETDATGYKLERSLDNTTWTTLAPSPALNATSSTYADTGLTAGTTYYYRLSGIDAAGTSTPASAVHAVTIPGAPTLTGTVASAGTINLNWVKVTGATSYYLQGSSDGGNTWTTLSTTTATTYANTGLTADTSYEYRLSANDVTGTGANSNVVTLTTALTQPSGLTATATSATQISLAWTPLVDATSYKLERSPDQTTWTTVAIPGVNGGTAGYTDTGLSAGTTYYYRFSAIDASGTSVPSAVAHALTIPAAPVLAGTVASAATINLSWAAIKSETSYTLETSTDGVNWTSLASPVASPYANTALTSDTVYEYYLTASDASGTSAPSNIVTLRTLLLAPTGLAATAVSATAVNLTWNPVADATNYKIERSVDQSTWSALVLSPALSGTSSSYTDTGASSGTTYYYRISAIDAVGTSAAATPTVHTLTYPAAPTLAGSVASASTINLSWAAVPTATSYLLESSLDGSNWTTLTTQSTLTYSNTALTADTLYEYSLVASNASGTSATSNILSKTTILNPPTNFAATPASATEIDLAWTAVTHATNYKIERSLNQTTWTPLVPSPALAGTSASYADTGLTAGTTYYYRISSINSVGTSAASSVIHALSLPSTPVLAGTLISATQVNLSWSAVSSATVYTVQLSNNNAAFVTVATPPAGATSYSVTGLTPDTPYRFRITVQNGAGSSAASNIVPFTTLLAPPTGFTVTASSSSPTEIDLAWTAVTDATGYKLERSLDDAAWTTLAPATPLVGTSAAYADTGLLSGTTYFYRISALNSIGSSAPTTVQQALTLPGAATLSGTSTNSTSINLTWTSVTGATSYLVEQSADSGTHWTTVTTTAALTDTVGGLGVYTPYEYEVIASDATGAGAASNTPTITTVTPAPSGFGVTTVSSPTEVDMSWTPVTNATSYLIERSTNQVTWTALTPNPALVGTSAAYNDTTASAATMYYYRISALSTAGSSGPTASGSALTLPVAPATFIVTVNSATSVTSTWTAVNGATGYQLQRTSDGTHWTTLATQTALAFTDTTAAAGTAYTYDVYALDGSGSSAPDTQNVTTLLPAPTNLTATASSSSPTEIDLAWTPVANAFAYQIDRSTNQANWTVVSTASPLLGTSASYADTTASAGTNYYYRISAFDTMARESAPSTLANALTLPAAPTLAATVASASVVNLSWNPQLSATSYLLERSTDAGTHWATASAQTGTIFSDTALTADTAYEYEVFTNNATGSSVASNTPSVTTILGSPAGFAATASSSSPTEIDLTWTATAHATSYEIDRSPNNSIFTALVPATPLVGTSAAYADTTALAGTTYYYRISGINAVGKSAPTTSVSALTLPGAATITATATSATTVNLVWTSVKSATSYLLEKSSDAGTHWTTVASPTGTTFTDTTLAADTTYQYEVTVNNATGAGAASTPASVTTYLAPPTGFAATASASVPTEIDLSWSAVTDATTYQIQRSLNQASWTTLVPATPLVQTSAAYADTTASAGTTYFYRIASVNAVGVSAYATAVTAQTLPIAPTLTATAASAISANLAWNAVTGATSYLLEKSIDAGTHWTTVVSQTNTTFTDTTLAADTTYEYEVFANDATGASAASTGVNVTTFLAAPASFAVTASASVPTEIDLSWTPVTHATAYKIERSPDNSVWATITQSPVVAGTAGTYADTMALAGSTYFYRISAIDAVGTSAPATAASAQTIPVAPTLTAGATSATSAHVSWTPSFGTTSYLLEKSIDAGTHWTTVTTQAATSYDDTTLTADTAYEYEVFANDATGPSAASTPVSITTILPAPAGFAVTASASNDLEVDLTWTPVTDATAYLIERSINQATWTTVTPATPLAGTAGAYADTTATGGTTFFYRISAINAVGTSAPATPASALTLPAAPTLSAVAESDTQIDLTWTPVDSATNYLVEKSIDSGTHWTTLSTLNTTLISDTGLTGDTTYEYQVIAINATGNSAASTPQTLTTLLSAPTGLAATAASATEVDLTWTPTTDATTYLIERSFDNVAFDTLVPATPLVGTSAAYADTTVVAGTLYYYRISAINANGTSAPSANVMLTTPLAPPTGLAATAVSSSQINLSWTNDTDAGLLNFILQSSSDNVHFTTLESVAAGSTSASDVRLTTATQYYYRLIAVNAGGNSAPTASVTATTM